MKEVYSFPVERKVEKTVPFIKKNDAGETVESTKTVVETEKIRIVFAKPSMAKIEEAEFFYGQKFNEYINSGFLTKAMLNKKMGDLGGFASKTSVETLQKAFVDNFEASRVIQFYGEAKDLNDEQKEKLAEAKELFAESQNMIFEYEQSLRSQFSQTADAKAEQKLIEWLVFNLSYYEEEVDSNKKLFPIFQGDTFDEKRSLYLDLCEDIDSIDDQSKLKIKSIFDKSFSTLVRVASIWYNKIAETPEQIDEAIKDMFELEEKPEEQKEEKPKKGKSKKPVNESTESE